MITPQMTQAEMVREVLTDAKWANGQASMLVRGTWRKFRDMSRQGQAVHTEVREARSPLGNEWIIIVTRDMKETPVPMISTYTTMQSPEGIYAVQPLSSDEIGTEVSIFTPHFFRRYRERMGLGDELTTRQLIRRYMKRNLNGHIQKQPYKYKEHTSWMMSVKDGVALGYYVSLRLMMMKTFVTRDMAYAGRQERSFTRGEKERSQIPVKTTADMLNTMLTGKTGPSYNSQADKAIREQQEFSRKVREKENVNNSADTAETPEKAPETSTEGRLGKPTEGRYVIPTEGWPLEPTEGMSGDNFKM